MSVCESFVIDYLKYTSTLVGIKGIKNQDGDIWQIVG
jgi:hypothetical protein